MSFEKSKLSGSDSPVEGREYATRSDSGLERDFEQVYWSLKSLKSSLEEARKTIEEAPEQIKEHEEAMRKLETEMNGRGIKLPQLEN